MAAQTAPTRPFLYASTMNNVPLYIRNLPLGIEDNHLRSLFHSHTTIKVKSGPNQRYATLKMPFSIAIKELERPMPLRALALPQDVTFRLSARLDKETTSIADIQVSLPVSRVDPECVLQEYRRYIKNVLEAKQQMDDELRSVRRRLSRQFSEKQKYRAEVDEMKVKIQQLESNNEAAVRRTQTQAQEKRTIQQELDDLRTEKAWRDASQVEENRLTRRDIENWGATTKSWGPDMAVDRFLAVLQEFKHTSFTESHPLTLWAIPWPVLGDIQRLKISDMTSENGWDMVDKFFGYLKIKYKSDQARYRELCGEMRQAFHPDRWRSRNLLKTVFVEEERDRLEEAGNRVSQAVNRQMNAR